MAFDPHPQYKLYAPQWEKCRTTTEGEDAVKAAGTKYLPRLDGAQHTHGTSDYSAYKDRASFYGAMGRTVIGLTGAVMRKSPQIAYPEKDAASLEALGYAGEHLNALISQTVEQVVEVGRVGHLVDVPAVEDDFAGEEDSLTPYVTMYRAEDIITWHQEVLSGRRRLVLVVLREFVAAPLPEKNYEIQRSTRYRVLSLVPAKNADGDRILVYKQEVWVHQRDKEGNETQEIELSQSTFPRMKARGPLDFIPFRFTNWNGSESDVSKPPLVDLANVNLSHYKNSADLEHGRHYTALPTPWAAGFVVDKKQPLQIGSRTAWISEDSQAKADMLEFTGAGLGHLQEGMVQKEKQMAILGARLLESTRAGVEAAEAIKLRQVGDRSVLASLSQGVGDSWTWLLHVVWSWDNIGEPSESISVVLNDDFLSAMLEPQMLATLTQAYQSGAISWNTYFENLQRGEITSSEITADDEAERIQAGGPSPTLGVPAGVL